MKGDPSGLCGAADDVGGGRRGLWRMSFSCDRAVLQHHRERQEGMCLVCWVLVGWQVGRRYSVWAFGGESREHGRVKDGRTGGVGGRQRGSKLTFVAN